MSYFIDTLSHSWLTSSWLGTKGHAKRSAPRKFHGLGFPATAPLFSHSQNVFRSPANFHVKIGSFYLGLRHVRPSGGPSRGYVGRSGRRWRAQGERRQRRSQGARCPIQCPKNRTCNCPPAAVGRHTCNGGGCLRPSQMLHAPCMRRRGTWCSPSACHGKSANLCA